MQIIDHRSYDAAINQAEQRARHSYFDNHVIEDRETGYITIDEGDYPALPAHLIDRIVYTAQGRLMDEI